MLNLQAALGVSQIDELEKFIAVKQVNYGKYKQLLADIPGIKLLPFKSGQRANQWFYSLFIEDKDWKSKPRGGTKRDVLMKRLIDEGVACRPIWKLIHTQKAYLTFRAYDIEKAYFFERNILNIPCSVNLTDDDIHYVCEKITGV
jgi:dTDP-4-amino-4,6-dideoxygalactose transaminase